MIIPLCKYIFQTFINTLIYIHSVPQWLIKTPFDELTCYHTSFDSEAPKVLATLISSFLLVASVPAPGTTRRHDDGMGRRSRLESISIPLLRDGRVDWHPSFSFSFLSIYFLYPYLMLTLDLSSYKKGDNLSPTYPLWLKCPMVQLRDACTYFHDNLNDTFNDTVELWERNIGLPFLYYFIWVNWFSLLWKAHTWNLLLPKTQNIPLPILNHPC